ncbi:GH3 auxin-responsive promoter family protein [Anaerofilum sp. BX8]|uniref:GH3 auxin-responsive promoter family protein n=1 Tax=Anaerofilum hominis TaxID=2763016 RepID=A0A923I5A1_9FIRM|nr:GH3 auxin-responsive promoter family protein [Anaerofilum hominis]MBC5580563.1 GH3 auxin-responsive promoter family protein [Anaerofilum hominis]
MTFEEKLKSCSAAEIWQEYCGFLDLSMEEYMGIQRRLLMEQIDLMSRCALGQRFFGGDPPRTLDEFRRRVPLTSFGDYADVLLTRREEMLPAKPVVWLRTTWEGGDFPAKYAPYTESMLDTYKHNMLGAVLLATSSGKGRFHVKPGSRILYSLAPMPYATGLFPDLIEPELRVRFLPSVREARKLSFGQQSRRGYKLALQQGMNMFFGMSSVLYGTTRNLEQMGHSSQESGSRLRSILGISPRMLWRLAAGRYRSRRDGKPLLPKDLFRLDGFVCIGTDSSRYKDELEAAWGVRPMELAGGTEPTCLGTETWSKNGLVFFPDACFYEFIPEQEMLRNLADPSYKPHTYLINELVAGQNYELVITVLRGGAFLRYRVGDVYRCLRLRNPQDGLELPQFEYVDRIPTVIDIAGFTRITEREIRKVIEMSCLPVADWFALKEYDDNGHSFLRLYVELRAGARQSPALSREIIREHLSVYFRYYDGDYKDLKRLLGIDPLEVTMLPTGTIARYEAASGQKLPRVGAPREAVLDLLHRPSAFTSGEGDAGCR